MNIESWGPWKLIKTGFWLGIGFIVPTVLVYVFAFASGWLMTPSMVGDLDEFDSENYSFGPIDISQIEIKSQREVMNGNQLLVLGELINQSEKTVNTIEIEANLFNEEGVFVYQCSEYISKAIAASAVENYQIKCGCSKSGVPEYDKIIVSIVSVSSY